MTVTKKKLFALLLAAGMMLLSGCAAPADSVTSEDTNIDAPEILCAAFAEYDWTLQILGENPGGLRLTLLNDSGMDMHSYQPSVADMAAIADADLVIFTGGDSEFWIEDALVSSESDSRRHIEFMEIFQHNHDLADRYTADNHDHDHDHGHDDPESHDGHGHETPDTEDSHHDGHVHSTDEHLWLSLKMAPSFIAEITNALMDLDPENAEYYSSNASSYIDKINALDVQYESTASAAAHSTVLFADRYPFKYLLEDYGISHVAAFPGCSAETEASFTTILSLSDSIDSLSLNTVVILHKSDPALAQTIIKTSSNQDAEILILNSMQSVTAKDIRNGASWLSIMESNLETLKKALQ